MPVAIQWRRLDVSGRENFLLQETPNGWLLSGFAVFLHEHQPCGFSYSVNCTEDWRTLSADISGHVGIKKCNYQIRVLENSWRINGKNCPQVMGCIDLDIGFSPATNTLPIRRLKLAEGESAEVKAAWFQFPEMELASLAQTYTRKPGNKYLYESPESGFACTIETNQYGLVTNYPGFWIDEEAT